MPDFDPDKYLASEDSFDPDAYLGQAPKPKMSPVDAAVSKFGQGLTLGYMDEIAGGLEAGAGELGEMVGLADEKPFIERYREQRDLHRARSSQAEQDQPAVALGADLAGSATSLLSPAGMATLPAKGAKFLPALTKTAAMGGVTGFGGSSADVTKGPDQLKEALADAGQGVAVAGALQTAAKPAAYVAGKLAPEALKKMANERAVKAAVGGNKKAIKDLVKTDQIQKVGADLLDEGAVGWFSKAEDILPKTQAAKQKYGQAIGDLRDTIDSTVKNPVRGRDIAAKLSDELDKIPATPKNEGVRNALKKEIDFYAQKGDLSFKEAQDLKGSYVFKPTDSTTQTLGQDVTNSARRAVSDTMEDAVSRTGKQAEGIIGGEDLAAKAKLYEQLKSKYGSMASMSKAGEDRAIANLTNRFVSPSDYAAGGALGLGSIMTGGAGLGAAAMTAGGAAANKFARERGSAFAARTADKLSRIMAADPAGLNRFRGVIESAAQRGPQALMLTHTLLSEDPEYQQIIDSQP